MLKHVLLKYWCAIIILIFSLRCSKCAVGSIKKLPHKTTLASLIPTRNRSIGAAGFIQYLPYKPSQSPLILTMPWRPPKTKPRISPNLGGSHSETTRNGGRHEIPEGLKEQDITWIPILPMHPSKTGKPRRPPNLGGSYLETTRNHGRYEIAEGPKEQGTPGYKPKTRIVPWITPPWGFGNNNKTNIPNFGISNLGTASQHQQYATLADLVEPEDWQDVPGAMPLAGSRYPSKLHPNHNSEKSRLSKIEYFTPTDALKVKFKLWPDGVVPYFIDALSYSDKVLRDRIRSFLNVVNSLTPLRFTELPFPPRNDNTRWVFFINRRGLLGCADHSIKNFTNEGVQQVILGYECLSAGGELAEAVLTIAGVPPQHNAPNRDDYIKVIENNILPEKQYLFQKLPSNEWVFNDMKFQNGEYDFLSAGHYHHHRYSANGRATIELRENYSERIGDTRKLSDGDIQKLNWLYGDTIRPLHYLNQLPTCNKLFVRDPKFIQPQMKELMNNEGLPDKTNDAVLGDSLNPPETEGKISNNEEDNDDNEKDSGDDAEDNKEDSGETVIVSGLESVPELENVSGLESVPELENVSGLDSPERPERLKRPSGVQLLKKQDKLSNNGDPLSYLSDYRTGDERYAQKLHKNVGVQYMQFGKSAMRRN